MKKIKVMTWLVLGIVFFAFQGVGFSEEIGALTKSKDAVAAEVGNAIDTTKAVTDESKEEVKKEAEEILAVKDAEIPAVKTGN